MDRKAPGTQTLGRNPLEGRDRTGVPYGGIPFLIPGVEAWMVATCLCGLWVNSWGMLLG